MPATVTLVANWAPSTPSLQSHGPDCWNLRTMRPHVGRPYCTLQGEAPFMLCSGCGTPQLYRAGCHCGPHTQEAPQRLGLTHSLEPGWGKKRGLVPAPPLSAESSKHGRKRGTDKDEILFAQHVSPQIYFTFMTTLGDGISQPPYR